MALNNQLMKYLILILLTTSGFQLKSQNTMPSKPIWTAELLGDGFFGTVIEVIDFNQDGRNELLVHNVISGNESRIKVFNQDLKTLYCEMNLPGYLLDIFVNEVSLSQTAQLIAATDSVVATYDLQSCDEISRISLPEPMISIQIADIDLDGSPEIVYSNSENLYKFSINNPDGVQVRLGFGGRDIKIQSMGREEGLDIALFNPSLTLLQGDDFTTINEFLDIGRTDLAIGDANGDDNFEVIVKNPDKRQWVAAYDVYTGALSYELDVSNYSSVEKVIDFNGDGVDDIVLNGLKIYDFQGVQLFELEDSNYFNEFVLSDFDGDGTQEFLFKGEANSALHQSLLIVSKETGFVTWKGLNIEGPYSLSDSFVEDTHGQKRIAASFLTSDNGYEIGGAMTIDTHTGQADDPWRLTEASWGDINAVEVGEVTAGSGNMMCFSGDDTYDPFVYCGDIESGDMVWRRAYYGRPELMKIIDLDGDNDNELLVMSSSSTVSAYHLENGFLLWQSDNPSLHIESDFNGLHTINDEIWIVAYEKIIKINQLTGTTLLFDDTAVTAFDFVNNKLYGAVLNQGFGELNIDDLSISRMIYPTSDYLYYLNVSGDGNVALIATTESPEYLPFYDLNKQITFVSNDNAFEPWGAGEMIISDSNFPNQYDLYIASNSNVKKFDLRGLNENIFKNGFE